MNNLMTSRRWVLIGLLVAGVLLVGVVWILSGNAARAQNAGPRGPGSMQGVQMGSAHFRLDWHVIGSGGGELSSTHFRLRHTIGQAAIGDQESTNFKNHAGYWQEFIFRVYLPAILKAFS